MTLKCDDIDECTTHRAACHHTCTNTFGGYQCGCRKGFKLYEGSMSNYNCLIVFWLEEWRPIRIKRVFWQSEIDGRTCIDINECETENDCQHLCQNLYGKYKAKLRNITSAWIRNWRAFLNWFISCRSIS